MHPQLLLVAFGPDSAGNDLAGLGPEGEAGRAVAAVAGLPLGACCGAKCEPLLVPDDDDGRGGVGVGANLTTVGLLPVWAAAAPLSSSLMLLREDVDMLSEEDDLFTSTDSNRLCDAWVGLLGFSMEICYVWWYGGSRFLEVDDG